MGLQVKPNLYTTEYGVIHRFLTVHTLLICKNKKWVNYDLVYQELPKNNFCICYIINPIILIATNCTN